MLLELFKLTSQEDRFFIPRTTLPIPRSHRLRRYIVGYLKVCISFSIRTNASRGSAQQMVKLWAAVMSINYPKRPYCWPRPVGLVALLNVRDCSRVSAYSAIIKTLEPATSPHERGPIIILQIRTACQISYPNKFLSHYVPEIAKAPSRTLSPLVAMQCPT